MNLFTTVTAIMLLHYLGFMCDRQTDRQTDRERLQAGTEDAPVLDRPARRH